MNKTFNQANDKGKLVVAKFIKEEKLGASLHFQPKAHNFFKKKYKRIYETWILKNDKEISLTVLITGVSKGKRAILKVKKLSYYSDDATAYNSDCYQIFTAPLYPNG